MNLRRRLWTARSKILLCLLIAIAPITYSNTIYQPDTFKHFCDYLSADELFEDWQPLFFPGINKHNEYQWLKEGIRCVIYARSSDSASALIYRKEVDLFTTPILSWSWKVSNTLEKGDARSKSGDDFVARVYVAFKEDTDKLSLFEKIKRKAIELIYGTQVPGSVINYIWANHLSIGTATHNAYTQNSLMIAVKSGQAATGKWHTEQRNVLQDYRNIFGKEPPEVIGIAIMTDTDNTGESAEAWYGSFQMQKVDILEANHPLTKDP